MCGIVLKHNFDGSPVNEEIFDQFAAQRNRGTQGFGLFDGQEMNIVRSTTENKILKWLAKYDSNLIMFHHRFPTSTINVKRAAHPLSTGDYFGDVQYVMVHNGVISNSNTLNTGHVAQGIKYKTLLNDLTFNDSESLLWDLALTLEGKQKEMKCLGDMAFVAIRIVDGKLDKMFFGRNGRPLMLFRDKETIELSSEGRGEEIDTNKLYTWNYPLKRLTSKPMTFTTGYSTWKQPAKNGGYYGNGGYYSSGYSYSDHGAPDDWQDYFDSRYGEGYNDEYEQDFGVKPPKMLPKTYPELLPKVQSTAPLVGEIVEVVGAALEPSLAEVQDLVMDVLLESQGHFEQAYWALEAFYDEVFDEDDEDADETIKRRLLVESAMRWLESDPEYTSDESISTMWAGVLWA